MKRISNLEKQFVLDVLDNQFRTSSGGKYTKLLEDEFAKKIKVSNAIAFTNGTATMHASLEAFGVGHGDEVIVPPLTMAATSFAVFQANAIPIFADVNKDTFTIDPYDIQRKITSKTKAIITVSLYGLSADIDHIKKIIGGRDIKIIEDNAEAFLSTYKGKYVGSLGEVGSFSFQSSKHITAGEGGIITTNDNELALKIRRIQSLGYAGLSAKKSKIEKKDIQQPGYERHISMGWNYRMSELCAAVSYAQTLRIDELVNARIKAAKRFEIEAKNSGGVLIPQFCPKEYENTYWTWVAKLRNDINWIEFRDRFVKNGGDGIYAPWMLTYKEPLIRNKKILGREKFIPNDYWTRNRIGCCPVAEELEKSLLQFKTNYWEEDKLDRQIEALKKTIKFFR